MTRHERKTRPFPPSLGKFPTKGPRVIQGPGENAGVIDIGDGQACIFKMESHNHPSYIEPYQGAATGVGGILRDVFTMGARPIALMNALRFGDPSHPKTRTWWPAWSRHRRLRQLRGRADRGRRDATSTRLQRQHPGQRLVRGPRGPPTRSSTRRRRRRGTRWSMSAPRPGRDGIHGATMASAEFDDDDREKRPTVQVGDPFTEKLLLEACLELMATGAVIAIQDMGAAGLTSSASRWRTRAASASSWTSTRCPSARPA
jgi:phosphoribosylformylglycinamidine (FGAM) synthase-like enzyme